VPTKLLKSKIHKMLCQQTYGHAQFISWHPNLQNRIEIIYCPVSCLFISTSDKTQGTPSCKGNYPGWFAWVHQYKPLMYDSPGQLNQTELVTVPITCSVSMATDVSMGTLASMVSDVSMGNTRIHGKACIYGIFTAIQVGPLCFRKLTYNIMDPINYFEYV